LVAIGAAAAIIFLISSADARVAAMVDGQPITEADIQQRTRLNELVTHKTPEMLTNAGASAATFKQELRADIAKWRLERGGYDPRGAAN
jgi:hypothetical protein